MGSTSDLKVAEPAMKVLDAMGVKFEVLVASAHRTPDRVASWARQAASRGLKVIIALAGGAAHLAGVAAAYTSLPVIGVPVQAWSTGGLDSLLSMAQMPRGVPVAAMAVDGGANAALMAVRILALADEALAARLEQYREAMVEAVAGSHHELQGQLEQKMKNMIPRRWEEAE